MSLFFRTPKKLTTATLVTGVTSAVTLTVPAAEFYKNAASAKDVADVLHKTLGDASGLHVDKFNNTVNSLIANGALVFGLLMAGFFFYLAYKLGSQRKQKKGWNHQYDPPQGKDWNDEVDYANGIQWSALITCLVLEAAGGKLLDQVLHGVRPHDFVQALDTASNKFLFASGGASLIAGFVLLGLFVYMHSRDIQKLTEAAEPDPYTGEVNQEQHRKNLLDELLPAGTNLAPRYPEGILLR
jgi:hypothetical protein